MQPQGPGRGEIGAACATEGCCETACGLPQKLIMQVTRENLPLTSIRGVAAAWVVGLHVQPFWFPGSPAALVSVILLGAWFRISRF
jgi:hypothetical protein